MAQMDWKYTQNTDPEASPSVVYLTYGNRWTKEKAQDIYDGLEDIIKTFIDDEDFTSVSDLLTGLLGDLFTVDTVASLATTLRDLIASLFEDDDDDDEEPSETTTADPTDPTEPTEPTEPTDPTDPTEPTEPEDPEEPDDDFEFEFGMIFDISLPWILNLLEDQFGEGLEFADILGGTFDYLFTRVAMPYTSANGLTAYRTYGVLDNVDVFTCVLTMLLEVVTHGNNGAILDEMLGTDGILPAVIGLFDGEIADMEEINWIWFDSDFTGPLYGDSDIELPERSIVYLTYPNNWTEATADYLDANLADIVDSVIRSIDDDYASLSEMIAGEVDIYTDEIVNSLLKVFKDLIADIDRVLLDKLGVVLELDLTAWDNYDYDHVWGVTDRESFIDALCTILLPLGELFDWLLYGDDYNFFTGSEVSGEEGRDIIMVKGADGYAYGLVPLLEALGCEGVLTPAEVKAAIADDAQTTVRFKAILEPILAKLDTILANPVDEVLAIIPNLMYFINANGISVSLKNTLHAVLNIFDAVAPVLETSLDELLGFSVDDLTFTGIFNILKQETGLDLNAAIGEFMSTFWLGDLTVYTSANGMGAIRMDYSADEHRGDLITIIFCLLLQVIKSEENEAILRDMVGDDTYDVVLGVLNLQEFPMQAISWYNTEYANTGVVFSALTSSEIFAQQPAYGRLWTKQKADYIANNFAEVVDNVVELLGIEGENGEILTSLNDIIADLANGNIYTAENVNAIVEMIQDFVSQIDEFEAGEHAKALIKETFGIDLNHWNQYGPDYDWGFEHGDRAGFIAAIAEVLSPLNPILEWLLCDKDISFFVDENGDDSVTFLGAEGYAYGLIPLLEALKVENLLTPAEYYAAVDENPNNLLISILTPLFARVDEILAAPADEVLDMLPGIIYFVNSNGLDTAFKNILHPVYGILDAIKPMIEIDLYELLGIRLDEYNFQTLYELLLDEVAASTGFSFTELTGNAINELAVGTIVSYQSANGLTAYTMEYAPQADAGDMVTTLLRLGIRFMSYGDNIEAVKNIIREQDSISPDTRKYVLALVETLADYLDDPNGQDTVMGTLYYVFVGIDEGSSGANDILDQINKEWKNIIGLLMNSDSEIMRNIGKAIAQLLNDNFEDIFDEDGLASSGLLKFFARIREFFEKILNFFRNLGRL